MKVLSTNVQKPLRFQKLIFPEIWSFSKNVKIFKTLFLRNKLFNEFFPIKILQFSKLEE